MDYEQLIREQHLITIFERQQERGYKTFRNFVEHSTTKKWIAVVTRTFDDMIRYVKAAEKMGNSQKEKAFCFSFLLSYHLGEEFETLDKDQLMAITEQIGRKMAF